MNLLLPIRICQMTLFLYLFRYYYIFSLPANPSVYVVYETGIHTNGVHVL